MVPALVVRRRGDLLGNVHGGAGVKPAALRSYLLRMAYACHAPEPEDAVHDIILRLLRRGALEEDHPPAYWWEAAVNMARTQARHPFIPLSEAYDAPEVVEPEPSAPDLSGLKLAKDELDWLLAYYSHAPRKGLHSGRDTVRACRLRKKARAA